MFCALNNFLGFHFWLDNHREVNHWIFKFFFLVSFAGLPFGIAILVPYILLVKCIAIARDLDIDAQLSHVGWGFSFGWDIILLGVGIEQVDNKLGVNHLGIHDRGYKCLGKFVVGIGTLEDNSKFQITWEWG
jgi:hypothetical protein